MNAAERQALREKHSNKFTDEFDKDICAECGWMTPCDVIKVLDDCEGLVNHFEEHYGMVYCFTCEKEL